MTDEQLDLTTAALQLQAAVDQLTQPGTVKLDRDIPIPGTDAYQLAADDAELIADTWADLRHTVFQRNLDDTRRLVEVLVLAERRREARTAPAADTPPLLHQLQDAIGGGTNTDHGAASAGASRSPLALAALDLVTEICTTTGARRGAVADALCADVRAWADKVCIDETQVVAAAEKATSWPDRGREILDPTKRWTTPGACPDCGRTTAYTPNDAGETVRRPTIELDREKATARCLSCGSRWEGETELRQLAKVLEA